MKEKEIDDDDDDDDTDGSPPFKSSTSIFSKFCGDYSFEIPLSLGSKMRASQLLSIFYKNVGRMHTANRRLCYQEDLEGKVKREKEDICKALK